MRIITCSQNLVSTRNTEAKRRFQRGWIGYKNRATAEKLYLLRLTIRRPDTGQEFNFPTLKMSADKGLCAVRVVPEEVLMVAQRRVSGLQRSEIFESLSSGEMARLLGVVEQLDLPRHHQIFGPGSPNQSIFFIERGSVRVTRPSPDGKSFVIISLLGPGDLLGDIAWAEDTHDCSAETLEDCRIYQLARRDFDTLVKENPAFALGLIHVLASRLKQAQSRIEDLVFRQVPSRVAKLFMNLAENHGKVTPYGIVLDLPLTHQEIADIVGSSRVTVTQVLNRFRAMKWVAVKSKRVTIQNIEALEELIANDANPRKRGRDPFSDSVGLNGNGNGNGDHDHIIDDGEDDLDDDDSED